MNERIQTLALQAGVFAGDFAGAGLYSIHNRDEVEKFAELIVRECGKVYIQNQQDGVMTLTQDLLQHFGVEE